MKRILLVTFTLLLYLNVSAQNQKVGTVVKDSLFSKNLVNKMGENPKRSISVYLPPNYATENKKYPVIYFLHGFLNDDSLMDSMKDLLDYALEAQKIKPFILVIPDQKTTYDGSFYSNTGVFGNWEDFTAFDLVSYMDANYRTIPKKDSRGITGHSMGGYGAVKIAMKHPDIFGSVYAISPGALAIVGNMVQIVIATNNMIKLKRWKIYRKPILVKSFLPLLDLGRQMHQMHLFIAMYPFHMKGKR